MFKKFRTLALIVLLIQTVLGSALVVAQNDATSSRALAERYYEEVWVAGDIDPLPGVTTFTFQRHGPPSLGPQPQRIEQLRSNVLEVHAAMPDVSFSEPTVVASGDLVGIQYIYEGTFSNAMGFFEPTGEPLQIPVVELYRVEDGELAEAWAMWDAVYAGRQMGLVPVPDGMTITPVDNDVWLADFGESSTTPEENMALIEQVRLEVFNEHNSENLADYFTEDFALHDQPSSAPEPLDLAGFEGWLAGVVSAMPDFEVQHVDGDTELVVAEGNLVIGKYVLAGTAMGEMIPGVPPNNAEITWNTIDIFRFEDGKIAEMWIVHDTLDFISQITAPPTE